MILPYSKCKCCGKRVGFLDWYRFMKELWRYIKLHGEFIGRDAKNKKEYKEELLRRTREHFWHK